MFMKSTELTNKEKLLMSSLYSQKLVDGGPGGGMRATGAAANPVDGLPFLKRSTCACMGGKPKVFSKSVFRASFHV